MGKSDKNSKLDLAPRAYPIVRFTLSKSDKENIKAIKSKYNYKNNLTTTLENLPTFINTFHDTIRQRGRSNIKKKLLTKTIKAAESLKECIKCFSIEMRMNMRDDHLKNKPYGAFEIIPSDLLNFIQKCKEELNSIPKDKGGQNKVHYTAYWLEYGNAKRKLLKKYEARNKKANA